MRKFSSLILFSFFLCFILSKEPKYVVYILNEVVSTPRYPFKGTEDIWKDKSIPKNALGGGITTKGLDQAILLGESIISKFNIIPNETYSASLLDSTSIFDQRNILTAQSVLFGMYRDDIDIGPITKMPQIFAIHTNNISLDYLLNPAPNCPLYDFLVDNEIMLEEGLRVIQKNNSDFIESIKKKIDEPTITMKNFTQKVYYPLLAASELGMNFTHGITRDDFLKIQQIVDQIDPYFYASEYRILTGGNLLKRISNEIQDVVDRNGMSDVWKYPTKKMAFFSVDSPSFSGFLSALKAPLKRYPRFGEYFQIVLYDNENEGLQIEFKLNGENHIVCDSTNVCSPTAFQKIVSDSYDPNWKQSCGIKRSRCYNENIEEDRPHIEASPINAFWWLFSLSSCFLIIGFSILIFWKWKKAPNDMKLKSKNRFK